MIFNWRLEINDNGVTTSVLYCWPRFLSLPEWISYNKPHLVICSADKMYFYKLLNPARQSFQSIFLTKK